MQKQTIGQQIYIQRKKAGLTQKQLVEISGISIFTIAGLEQGKLLETSTHTLRQLSRALNSYKFDI